MIAVVLALGAPVAAQEQEVGDAEEAPTSPGTDAGQVPTSPEPDAGEAPTSPGADDRDASERDASARVTHRPPSARFELKRTASNRGAIDQSTRTTLRAEVLLDSPVTLVRLELPFVDKNDSTTGESLTPGFGDLKSRVAFAPLPVPGAPIAFFFELVFPTARDSLGFGKYQVAPGVTATMNLASWHQPLLLFVPLLEHFVSFAGDPSRDPVNYTQAELNVEARWPALWLSLNAKPVLDWTKGGDSASVLELELSWLPSTHWRLWFKVGQRLWGGRLPATYDQQLELGVRWTP